jgi:hypothetical protein
MNNTTDSLAVLDPPAMPLASREPAAEPTIGMILQSAVQQGMDRAGLETIAAIYERERADARRQAFIGALHAFRTQCPPILKVLRPEGAKFSYADMEEVTKIVDPVLFRNGLTYRFDTEVQADRTIVTCTLSHKGGHSESSHFSCIGSGTKAMNSMQVAASATTYGRRYALTGVLGITTDHDNDGRRLAEPLPQPDADPAAPKVLPRAERAAPADPNRVTAADLNDLLQHYRVWTRNPDAGRAELVEWAAEIAGIDAKLLIVPRNWTRDGFAKCQEAMG